MLFVHHVVKFFSCSKAQIGTALGAAPSPAGRSWSKFSLVWTEPVKCGLAPCPLLTLNYQIGHKKPLGLVRLVEKLARFYCAWMKNTVYYLTNSSRFFPANRALVMPPNPYSSCTHQGCRPPKPYSPHRRRGYTGTKV